MKHTDSTLIGELIGRVRTRPATENDTLSAISGDDNEKTILAALVDEINRVIAPPVAVTTDTVFIRAMEVLSDKVNDHGGRFATDEFPRLCELIVDSPVLVAHDKRQLPVARNFKADVISRDGRPWIKVWFYWPKEAAGARDLASRIDSGVLREVSIGFEFKRPECSVCGADIRQCEHQPATEVKHPDGAIRQVHYIYRDIVRVLETSLVYRGATPGTRIGSGLFFHPEHTAGADVDICRPQNDCRPQNPQVKQFSHLQSTVNHLFDVGLRCGMPINMTADMLTDNHRCSRYVVTPLVEGLPVVLIKQAGEILLFDPDNHEFSIKMPEICRELVRKYRSDIACFGWLVRPGPGGKSREVTLFVEWLGSVDGEDQSTQSVANQRRLVSHLFRTGTLIRPVPFRWVDPNQLSRAVHLLSPAAGCRIHPADNPVASSAKFYELRRKDHLWLQIIDRAVAQDGTWRYCLALDQGIESQQLQQEILSPQRYPVGRVVLVSGSLGYSTDEGLKIIDPVIQYTPARRNAPDSAHAVQRMFETAEARARSVA